MRKYVVGIGVGFVLLVYSVALRSQHTEAILPPSSLSKPVNAASIAYKDGTYTGTVENAFYGNVQVAATIRNRKIASVSFLRSPHENPNSIYVNTQADPYLKEEALKVQTAQVGIITGATFTSQAFRQSLQHALMQAKVK